MVDTYTFNDITYTLGSAAVKTDLIYIVDTRSQFFYNEKGIDFDECGEHTVVCEVKTSETIAFFTFAQDTTINDNTYSYTISSNSATDVGIWDV